MTDSKIVNSDPFKRLAWPASNGPAASTLGEFCHSATRTEFLSILPELTTLIKRIGTDYWWMNADVRRAFEAHGLHVTQDHFYSPLPNTDQLADYYQDLAGGLIPAAVNLCPADRFYKNWRAVARDFAGGMADIPRQATAGYCWDNPFFPNLDALTYHGMIRTHRPHRVIEIGAGFSTHVAAQALKLNECGELLVIKPYPGPKLFELREQISLAEKPLQRIPDSVFGALEAGDILFIDGSHVCKTGSDLNYLMFTILPGLPRGVLLHFHDIFLPYEYPVEWTVGRGWAWNEQYLLLAWLMANSERTPLFGTHALICRHRECVAQDLADLDIGRLSGGSFWIA